MKLNRRQADELYRRFGLAPAPADSPEALALCRALGEDTYFLVPSGVLVFEPDEGSGRLVGVLVADWDDPNRGRLRRREPVRTAVSVPAERLEPSDAQEEAK